MIIFNDDIYIYYLIYYSIYIYIYVILRNPSNSWLQGCTWCSYPPPAPTPRQNVPYVKDTLWQCTSLEQIEHHRCPTTRGVVLCSEPLTLMWGLFCIIVYN